MRVTSDQLLMPTSEPRRWNRRGSPCLDDHGRSRTVHLHGFPYVQGDSVDSGGRWFHSRVSLGSRARRSNPAGGASILPSQGCFDLGVRWLRATHVQLTEVAVQGAASVNMTRQARSVEANWVCPFCGRAGQRTKDHVWPKWLRNYPMYEVMNNGYTGQRFEEAQHVMTKDADDRYREDVATAEHVAAFLPHVQVPVCRRCNNGWMSRMEIAVQDILDPMIRSEPITLTPDDQTLLAAWASKCAYAYAARWAPQNRPWSAAEYRDLALRQQLSPRAKIWMGHSTAPQAYIAECIEPLFMAPADTPAEQVTQIPPSGAGLYLAAHSVVFIAHWLPDDMFIEGQWEDWFSDEIREGLSRIWPSSGQIGWPTPDIPQEQLDIQMQFLSAFGERLALPIAGLTSAEVMAMGEAYLAGADPLELQDKWGT